jgi:hypothetical protein
MSTANLDHALAYAKQRVAATKRAYVITRMHHVLLDCALNRRLAEEHCSGLLCRVVRVRATTCNVRVDLP